MKFCPQCSLVLEEMAWEGTSPWACRSCGGAWWTGTESADALGPKRGSLAALNSAFPGIATAGMFEGLPLACPDCRTAFLDDAPAPDAPDAHGCSIPTCGKCGGVWLTSPARAALSGVAPPAPDNAGAAPPAPNTGGASTVAGAAPPAAAANTTPVGAGLAPPTVATATGPPEPEPQTEPVMGAIVGGASPAPTDVPEERGSYEPDIVEEEAAAAEAPPVLGAAGASLVCPRCLKVEPRDAVVCPECRVALVEPDFRILCPSCSAVNPFTAATCARCDTPLRTPERLAQLYPHVPTVNAPHEPVATDRPALLTDAAPGETPPVVASSGRAAQRWCPQCRRAYPASESICGDCGVGLAEGSYRVRCLRCNSENTLAAELCWNCHAPIHPPELQAGHGPLPPPAALPSDPWRAPARPSSGSCLGSVLSALLVVVRLVVALWLALMR